MSTGGRARRAVVGLAVVAALAGCADPAPRTPPAPAPSQPAPATPSPSTASSTPGSTTGPAAGTNDLKANRLQRGLRAGPVTVNVAYSTTLPVAQWKPGVAKPLRVAFTAVNNRSSGQKVYLTRLTATVSAYGDRGLLGAPRAITDVARVSPGYLVTFPTEYSESLTLPAVDPAARQLVIDLSYDLVLQVTASDQRDFAKQSATDRLTVALG